MIDLDEDLEESTELALPCEDGLYVISNRNYHELEGISSTNFKSMEKSQAAFANRKLFKNTSPALSKGSLWHTSILEPHLLADVDRSEYVESPTIGMDTVAARKLAEKHPRKIVVGKGMIDDSMELGSAVRSVFPEIFYNKNTRYEISALYNSPHTGLLHKARADILFQKKPGEYIIFDLKSTKETTREGFSRAISEFGYDVSAAWYIDTFRAVGINVVGYGWLCVPVSRPNELFAVVAADELVELGRGKYGDRVSEYIQFKKEGIDDRKFMPIHSQEYIRKLRREERK